MSQIQVPKEWKLKKLGDTDVAEIIMGQSPPSSTYNKVGNGIPFFQGKTNFGEKYPTPDTWCSKPKKVAERGDILICVRAPIGPTNWAKEKCCIGRGLSAIRVKINPEFVYYYFKLLEPSLSKSGQGSTFKAIGKGDLENISVPIPPHDVQKRIVQKLDHILKELEKNEKEIHSFTNYKKLFKSEQLLVQNIFDNIISQKQNKKWQKKSLGDLTIKSQNGKTGRPTEKPPGVPRLGITTVTHGTFGFVNENECKFQEIKESEIENYQIHDNDILICRQNGNKDFVGRSVVYRGNTKPLIFSDSLIRFQIKTNEIFSEFLMMFLNSTKSRKMIEPYCKTTAGNYSINATNLKKIEVDFPDLDTQKVLIQLKNENLKKIDQTGNEISRFLDLKINSLLKLEKIKNSILNSAFSGKLVN